MNLKQRLLVNNDCYKAGVSMIPRGVVVHDTGAGNANLRRYVQPDDSLLGHNANGNHWNRGGIDKCVHAFIGKLADGGVATYQTLPWTMRGWHAGGAANSTHIGFEICDDGYTDADYFAAAYREAVEFAAYLCGLYDLDPLADGVVIGHYEGYQRGIASNHSDPGGWFGKFGKSMDIFRRDVAAILRKEVVIMGKVVSVADLKAWMDANGRDEAVPAPAPSKPGNPYPEPTADVKAGSTGDGVKWVQTILVRLGYKLGSNNPIDGSFGSMTVDAVKAFQKAHGLYVDGIVGAKTRAKLKEV